MLANWKRDIPCHSIRTKNGRPIQRGSTSLGYLGGITFLLGGMLAVPSTYIDSLRFQMTMQSLQAEICALVATNFAYFGGTDQDISNLFQACSQEQSNEKEELCQNARTLASENEVDHSSPRQANSMQRGGIADDGSACIGSTSQSPDLIFGSACPQQQPNKEEGPDTRIKNFKCGRQLRFSAK